MILGQPQNSFVLIGLPGLDPYVLKGKKWKRKFTERLKGNTQLRKTNFIQEIFKADNDNC